MVYLQLNQGKEDFYSTESQHDLGQTAPRVVLLSVLGGERTNYSLKAADPSRTYELILTLLPRTVPFSIE